MPHVIDGFTSLLKEINSCKRKALNESKSKLVHDQVSGATIWYVFNFLLLLLANLMFLKDGLTDYEMEGNVIVIEFYQSFIILQVSFLESSWITHLPGHMYFYLMVST